MTPNKFLWGCLFNLYKGPTAKQRNLIIVERIKDLRPDLIGKAGDDRLLRKYDDTTLGTTLDDGRRVCIDSAAPAIVSTTTGESQNFIRKEHITVPFTDVAREEAAYLAHLAPARDNLNRLRVMRYVDLPYDSGRNQMQFRSGGWHDGRFGQQKPSMMTIDQIKK